MPYKQLTPRPTYAPTVQAVRDHVYMGKYANASDDPFIATSQRLYDRKFFRLAMAHEATRPKNANTPNGSNNPNHANNPTAGNTNPNNGATEEQEQEQELEQTQEQEEDDSKMPADFLHPGLQTFPIDGELHVLTLLKKFATPSGPWELDDDDGDGKSNSNRRPARALISTRTKAWKQASWFRIGAAVIGGAFLIAPMWILALQRNLYIHLGVATECITAFGASVSVYLETADNVFAATLAYAAVIMVFVGIVIEETGESGT